MKQLQVNYIKVDAHSGNVDNDIADQLVKQGVLSDNIISINHKLINRITNYIWNGHSFDIPIKQLIKTQSQINHDNKWRLLFRHYG